MSQFLTIVLSLQLLVLEIIYASSGSINQYPFINGGSDAAIGEFPFMVYIEAHRVSGSFGFCGGALIYKNKHYIIVLLLI